uniref:Uncharacterized protein n=1 Tax=Anguilla anguilla TaxID=7936 RepID=A0A0E9U5G4_ANGAN
MINSKQRNHSKLLSY